MDLPYRVITISGLTCAGTTTLTRSLSKILDWPHQHPASVTMRQFLREHNLPLSAIDQFPMEKEREMDDHIRSLIETEQHVIINGRLSGWLAQDFADVFKIFLTANREKRVERFAARENLPFDIAKEELEKREQNELVKYKKLYDIDARDAKFYDLVIDTSDMSPDNTLLIVLNTLKLRARQKVN